MTRRLPRELWSSHDLGRRSPPRRRRPPGETAAEPTLPLALSDLWDLRRLGLFDDDGRVPPSWWDR